MKAREEETGGTEARKRILGAALSAFMEGGYAQTSTLEIATRARFRNGSSTRCSATRKRCSSPASPSAPSA